jgi:protein required for attachment to host cells
MNHHFWAAIADRGRAHLFEREEAEWQEVSGLRSIEDGANQAFVQDVCDWLKMQFEVHVFERLILVAPPLMLKELSFCIDNALASKIVAEVGKDLTEYDSRALKDELARIVWF